MLLAVGSAGCRTTSSRSPDASASHPSAPTASTPIFVDVTDSAGVHFRHSNGGSGHKFMPETMGSGCAFIDYDDDGLLDLLLLNGRPLEGGGAPGGQNAALPTAALFHNAGSGRFTDATVGSGLDVPMFAMGCAVGDYDNDGRDDLFITCALDPCRLFRNEGGGRFRDVTRSAGVGNGGRWATSAAWLDYDRDGRLDLFVCNYVKYDLAHDVFCPNRLGGKSYCTPRHYEGLASTLYRNAGKGRFRDVSVPTGIGAAVGKALGVAVCDVNRDGWPDLYVANDTVPNFLFRNTGHGRFEEIGTEAGVAYGEDALARGGMGVDAATIGPKGELALFVANFSNEPCSFFWEEGPEFFTEQTLAVGLAQPTLLTLGFGAFFFDYDNDSAADLFMANGHVQDDIHLFQSNLRYAQPHQLFRNHGGTSSPSPGVPALPTFTETGPAAGVSFTVPRVSRGAAKGDWDNDGDLDLLISNNNGPCELLRNDGGSRAHWLETRLVGGRSNRNGIGAEVRVRSGDRVWRDRVRSGSSYCSAGMLRLHFGLGNRARYDAIEIVWPSGLTERWPGGAADRILTLSEGRGSKQ